MVLLWDPNVKNVQWLSGHKNSKGVSFGVFVEIWKCLLFVEEIWIWIVWNENTGNTKIITETKVLSAENQFV